MSGNAVNESIFKNLIFQQVYITWKDPDLDQHQYKKPDTDQHLNDNSGT
jgi:hypothetical protein